MGSNFVSLSFQSLSAQGQRKSQFGILNYAYVGWKYFMSNLEITCHRKEHTSRAADCLSSTATALPSNSNNNNMQCDYASVFFSTPVWCLLSQSCQGWSAGGEMDELPSMTLEEALAWGKRKT
ncbi:hypothetical protein DVH24_016297 [Malus domestica]|uniref:Uncharacterized protein n=1 Tax=Malus domestica TaxID=3750 RepID=A0A498HVD4_MALDO|nr:hypothetical protein DVH24_016297 [Malus domestica]